MCQTRLPLHGRSIWLQPLRVSGSAKVRSPSLQSAETSKRRPPGRRQPNTSRIRSEQVVHAWHIQCSYALGLRKKMRSTISTRVSIVGTDADRVADGMTLHYNKTGGHRRLAKSYGILRGHAACIGRPETPALVVRSLEGHERQVSMNVITRNPRQLERRTVSCMVKQEGE